MGTGVVTMVYEMEIITSIGNSFRAGGKTLTETRVKACKLAKDRNATVVIRERIPIGMGFWTEIERIWYDPSPASNSWAYTNFKGGYWINIYARNGKVSKRCRVSPKTGKLLNASKEWKYL